MLLIRQLLKCYNENENFNKKIPNSNVGVGFVTQSSQRFFAKVWKFFVYSADIIEGRAQSFFLIFVIARNEATSLKKDTKIDAANEIASFLAKTKFVCNKALSKFKTLTKL